MKAAWVGAGSRYKIPLLHLRTDIIVEKSRCNNKVSRIIRIPFSIRFILSRIRHGSHLRGRKSTKLRETSSSCVSLPLLSKTGWSEEREPTSMHKLSAAVRSGPFAFALVRSLLTRSIIHAHDSQLSFRKNLETSVSNRADNR